MLRRTTLRKLSTDIFALGYAPWCAITERTDSDIAFFTCDDGCKYHRGLSYQHHLLDDISSFGTDGRLFACLPGTAVGPTSGSLLVASWLQAGMSQ